MRDTRKRTNRVEPTIALCALIGSLLLTPSVASSADTDVAATARTRLVEMPLPVELVLIDEIDLHLHPLWQVEIISTLRQQFPRLHRFDRAPPE